MEKVGKVSCHSKTSCPIIVNVRSQTTILTNIVLNNIVVLFSGSINNTIVRVHLTTDQGDVQFCKAVDGLLNNPEKTTTVCLNLWKNCQKENFIEGLTRGGYVNCTVGQMDEDSALAFAGSTEGDALEAYNFDGNRIEDVREENGLLEVSTEDQTPVTLNVDKNTAGEWVVTDGTHESLPYKSRDKARDAKRMYDGDPAQWRKYVDSVTKVETPEPTPEPAPSKGKKKAAGLIEKTKVTKEDKKSTEAKEKKAKAKGENVTPIPELQDGEKIELGKCPTKSDKIRYLHGLSWTPAAIAKFLNANYSFVYSVVSAQKKGKKWVNWKKNKPGYQERRRKVQSTRFRDELEEYCKANEGDRKTIMEFVRWLEGKTTEEGAE